MPPFAFLGSIHPQIVHFVVALGVVGVACRLISLSGRPAWAHPVATTLLLLAAGAGFLAVLSGGRAHGPVERIPGVGPAVHEHEEAGEWARNILLLVAALEIGALALRKREKLARGLVIASGVVGIAAGFAIYRAGDLGGDLVYDYAGGVGMRPGAENGPQRVLIAGLFGQARVAREAGRKDESQRLTAELARQLPDDPAVQLLTVESILKDREDPQAALAALAAFQVPADNPRLAIQAGLLQSSALAAAGQRDSARALLESLRARFPGAGRTIGEVLEQLK